MTPDIHRSVEADRIPPTWDDDVRPLVDYTLYCMSKSLGCLGWILPKPPDVKRAKEILKKKSINYGDAIDALTLTSEEWGSFCLEARLEQSSTEQLDNYATFFELLSTLARDAYENRPPDSVDQWGKIDRIKALGKEIFPNSWPCEEH